MLTNDLVSFEQPGPGDFLMLGSIGIFASYIILLHRYGQYAASLNKNGSKITQSTQNTGTKFVLANSEDPTRTALKRAVWSGSTLFAKLPAVFGLGLACQGQRL